MSKGYVLPIFQPDLLYPIFEETTPSTDKWADATSDSDEDIEAFILKCRINAEKKEKGQNEQTNMHVGFGIRESNQSERFFKKFHYWTNWTEADFVRAKFNWVNLVEALADFKQHQHDYYLKEVKQLMRFKARYSHDFIQIVASALYKHLPDGFVLWDGPDGKNNFEEWHYRPFTSRVFGCVECKNPIPIVFVKDDRITSIRWLPIQ